MLQLIKRCPEYAEGYKAYCQELYDHNVVFFRPSNPKYLEDDWFERTKDWYEQKEKGLVEGQPVSFHYWAVDDDRFIGDQKAAANEGNVSPVGCPAKPEVPRVC
jgi:hypothetical protein